jgi:putative salt-induced outer membrane protein YdiY
MRGIAALFLLVLSGSDLCFGGQVVLTNGDRLTGSIVKSDAKTVVIKTELAGTVEIELTNVKELVSDKPLYVTSASKSEAISGTVEAKDNTLVVTSGSGETVSVPQAEVKTMRSQEEQAAYEKSLHPGLLQGWKGGVNVGYALTAGNSETSNLALAFLADRETLTDKLGLYAKSVYAKNNAPGAIPSTTANSIQGGARYDRNINKRLFGFVNADFQTDELQELNLRSLFGGGLGYHAIIGERTKLDFLGGANYTHESYFTFSRNFAALTLGEEFFHQLANTEIKQRFFFFPDMNNFGEYHTTLDVGTVTKLNKWLGWQNSFSDIYVTNPPVGRKKNDIVFTTGLNVTFTH